MDARRGVGCCIHVVGVGHYRRWTSGCVQLWILSYEHAVSDMFRPWFRLRCLAAIDALASWHASARISHSRLTFLNFFLFLSHPR